MPKTKTQFVDHIAAYYWFMWLQTREIKYYDWWREAKDLAR